mmetsp:Transcript_949/g.2277  ORF Transcript_949/g.2277 Transcript_949/m.2277 type:complete len:360 (-) Transcript_949:2919-3998(-)
METRQIPQRASTLLLEDGGVVYLIGGVNDKGEHYGDVWQWKNAWTKSVIRNPEAFSPRAGHVGFIAGGKAYIYGGHEEPQPGADLVGRIYADWVRLDLEALEFGVIVTLSQVEGRHSASLVYLPSSSKAIVFGGCTSNGLENTVYIFDIHTHAFVLKHTHNPPEARMMHTASWSNDSMYVYGGLLASQQCSASLHVLDTNSWAWRDLGIFTVDEVPMKACGLTAVYARDHLILFGGFDTAGGTVYDQCFLFNPVTLKWSRDPEHRNSRFCGSMTLYQEEEEEVLFLWGGYDLINSAIPKFADSISVLELLANKEELNYTDSRTSLLLAPLSLAWAAKGRLPRRYCTLQQLRVRGAKSEL